MKVTIAFLLVAVFSFCRGEGANHKVNWDYEKKGPSTWGGACKGSSQSPINIVTCETESSNYFNRIINHNYWKPASGTYKIHNNGHALQIDLPKNTPYQLTKGQKKYTPLQIHIHFNAITGKGSEHTLNSKQYFAEIHIVHRNSMYPDSTQFMKHKDGLLVIGLFVDLVKGSKLSASSDLDYSMNYLSSPLSQTKVPNGGASFAMHLFGFGAEKVPRPGMERTIKAFPLAWVLPTVYRKKSMWGYVNYKGSLTTPPCSEIVDWIVITGKTLQINEEIANKFKNVNNSLGKPMSGNFRPIQDLNGREVYGVKGNL